VTSLALLVWQTAACLIMRVRLVKKVREREQERERARKRERERERESAGARVHKKHGERTIRE